MNICAVTYVSDMCHAGLAVLDHSCAHYDWRIARYTGPWGGLGEKLNMAKSAAFAWSSYTHLLVIDAYDTFVIGGPDEVLERFLEFGHPMVFQGNAACWPDTSQAEQFPDRGVWSYLNAGAYIAEREYLVDFFETHHDFQPGTIDQKWFTDIYLSEPGVLEIDTGCKLFQCVRENEFLSIADHRLHNDLYDTWPLVVHNNGGKTNDTPWLRELWAWEE
jgi:hypothetical protein